MGPTRMRLSKPVIAAIEGHAVAGGLELALWCDLRVAAADAVLGVFCRRWGVPLIDGGTVRLPRLIGTSRALDLILTGRPVDAAEAERMGLVNRVVPTGTARVAAEELARVLAGLPQECLRNDRLSVLDQAGLEEADALGVEYAHGAALPGGGRPRRSRPVRRGRRPARRLRPTLSGRSAGTSRRLCSRGDLLVLLPVRCRDPPGGVRLPRRPRHGHDGVPRRGAGEAAAGRGPGRGRQDRARQGRGPGDRGRPGPAAVLRGARRGAGAVRVELQEAAAADPGLAGRRPDLVGDPRRHLHRRVPADPAAADRDPP